MENKSFMSKTRKFFDAYEVFCKPYCDEIGLSVQAFEILLTISKYSDATANDICKNLTIKPTLMSFHVEKLVQLGLIERQSIEGNRRSIRLVCSESAKPIIEKGKALSKKFISLLWDGITKEEIDLYNSVLGKMSNNIDKILKGDK